MIQHLLEKLPRRVEAKGRINAFLWVNIDTISGVCYWHDDEAWLSPAISIGAKHMTAAILSLICMLTIFSQPISVSFWYMGF